MDLDITPFVQAPPDTDLEIYKQTLMERFANKSVSDQVARLCADGISKFPVYIVPNLAKMITGGKDLTRSAFLLATYRHYLKYKTDDNGQSFTIVEPGATADDEMLISSENAIDFLDLSALKKLRLSTVEPFLQLYLDHVTMIKEQGITKALDHILV